jgi:Tol biopolymer transport system component
MLYGKVDCQPMHTCGIHLIDLSTGQESSIPGSEAMGTARWSPDGRLVAALQPSTRQIFVLDMATRRWRKLADGMNGWALSWAPDSRSIYTSNPDGDAPAVFRIWLANSRIETVLDLSGLSRLPGMIGKWFGITPDGSIIVLRWISTAEIFGLDYEEK